MDAAAVPDPPQPLIGVHEEGDAVAGAIDGVMGGMQGVHLFDGLGCKELLVAEPAAVHLHDGELGHVQDGGHGKACGMLPRGLGHRAGDFQGAVVPEVVGEGKRVGKGD